MSISGERKTAGFRGTLRLLRVSDLREAAGGRQGARGQLQEDLPRSGHWKELGPSVRKNCKHLVDSWHTAQIDGSMCVAPM